MASKKKVSTKKKSASKKKVTKKVSGKTTPSKEVSNTNKSWFYLAVALALVVIILAILLLSSRVGEPDYSEYEYNNFEFTPSGDGMWFVRLGVLDRSGVTRTGQVLLYHHPTELEDIPVDKDIYEEFVSFVNAHHEGIPSQVYISVHPDAPSTHVIAGVEVAKVLGEKFNIFNLPTRSAFSVPSNVTVDVPVVTCWDAQDDIMVVWIKERGETLIAKGGPPNCFVLQANNTNDTIRVANRFVYEILGVMR